MYTDFAIVGAAAAGSAAALSLAGSGSSVVIIGRTPGPGRPGDSLGPAASAILAELGLGVAFRAGPHRPSNAIYSSWGTPLLVERHAITHTEGGGHLIDRSAFDRMLAEAAACTAAQVIQEELISARQTGRGWALTLSGGRTVHARFVLDASGRRAAFARHTVVRRRADRLVAAFSFLRQQNSAVDPTPATLIEAVPCGWWYAALLPDGRMSLALFSDPDTTVPGLMHDVSAWRRAVGQTRYLNRWLDSAGFSLVQPPRLASAATTWLETTAGPDWAAVGDAAAAFDPLSSHGLTTALWSGRRAALAALDALGGNRQPLFQYGATMAAATNRFLDQRRTIYSAEQRFRNEPFWQRRHGAA